MENTGRRSLRVKKKPQKYRSSSSDSDKKLSESESSGSGDTDEIINKLSMLQTSSNPGAVSNPKKYLVDYSDEDRPQNSSTDKKETVSRLRKTLSKRGRKKKNEENTPEKNDSDETSENIEKPSEVLFEGQNVSGKNMFGFKRNKRRGGMAQRVFEAVNSPHKPFNLTKSIQNSASTSGTPQKVATRNSIQKKMKEKVAELDMDSSFEDFSDSGSEFKGSDSESSDTDLEEKESHESDNDTKYTFKTSTTSKKKLKDIDRSIVTRNNKTQNYVMKSDDYFSWQSSSKIVTSNHTLQKLKNPKLSEDQLQELLTSCNLNQSSVHEKAIHEMLQFSCNRFNKWMFILHEGFNILLYGLGSKRNILKTFHEEMLDSSLVVVVNGYFPSLTIKDITDSILTDILEIKNSTSNVYEAVELISKKCERQKNVHLYLIVHNIDGPMLRNNKSQNVISSLADIPNVHLIASIDHINTPLIWDHYKLSKFNFTWWDVTSFLPYSDETSFESSMLVQRSGALALASLGNVYQSLTKNSKGIFMLIVNYQLNNKSVKYYQGMPFKVLYSQCREHFLVSSDLALRTQLTEFLDHKLVKSKRAADGVEQLMIPIHNSLLQQFLDLQS